MADSSYFTAWQITGNVELQMRVAASVQQEAEQAGNPVADVEAWAREHRWEYSTQADWIAAVQAAIETGIGNWGSNTGVITDQMILSYVQPAVAP